MFDLLWSDPRNEKGRGPSGRGVDCVAFGPDVTERFLSDNHLDVCIRSHQVRELLWDTGGNLGLGVWHQNIGHQNITS